MRRLTWNTERVSQTRCNLDATQPTKTRRPGTRHGNPKKWGWVASSHRPPKGNYLLYLGSTDPFRHYGWSVLMVAPILVVEEWHGHSKKKKVVQKVVQKVKNSKVTSSRNPQVNDLNQLSKLAGDCLVNEFCSLK